MSIKSDLDYLEQTKGLIKEAIINKGQDIEDNTPFRDYVDKIDNISTEPTKPLGIKVYKRAEILDDQTDLINYYVQGAQTGEFANLNSYQIRFTYIDAIKKVPITRLLQIIDTNPSLMYLSNPSTYYFNPAYTQVFIQVVTSLGLYDAYVTSFLQNWNLTEQQLLQFNGWYGVRDGALITTTHPIIEHANIYWAIKVTIQEFLMSTWGINNVLDFIDMDTTNLNITLVEEDDSDIALDYVEDINGDFLNQSTATEYQIEEGFTSFNSHTRGIISGKYVPKCYIFSQPNQAGTYTYEYMCCYPISNGSYIDRYEWKTEQQNLLDSHPGLFEIYSKLCGFSYEYDTDTEIISIIDSIGVSDLNALYTFVVRKGTGWLYLHGGTPGARIIGSAVDQQGNFSIHIITSHDNNVGNIEVILNATREMIQDQFTILSFSVDSIKRYSSTYDATATADDIVLNKTAYVNGQKITGRIPKISSGTTGGGLSCENIIDSSSNNSIVVELIRDGENTVAFEQGSKCQVDIPYTDVTSEISLTADKIKTGVTVLGVTGTYKGEGIKEYTSVADMNADIDNIEEGDIVKVVESNVTTFYIKEIETTYQPLDFSQLNIGDTISLKGMKINNTATSNVGIMSGDFGDFILSNNNETILRITFTGGRSTISGSITINNSSYNYTTVAEGEISELSAADVETINSSNIWSSDTLLTIENNGETVGNNYIENAILKPVQQGTMKKLIKEEDTLPVDEYVEATNISDDILGEETE